MAKSVSLNERSGSQSKSSPVVLDGLGEFETVNKQTLDFVSGLHTVFVSNSPNPSRVYIRLCKHGKCLLLLS